MKQSSVPVAQADVAEMGVPPTRVQGSSVDYQAILAAAPDPYVVLSPDGFVIVAVTDAYLRATGTRRGDLVGRRILDVFPDASAGAADDGARSLRSSLDRVKRRRQSDVMAVRRYPRHLGSEIEERWWRSVHTPVLDAKGTLNAIIHRAEDVTEFVQFEDRGRVNAASGAEATGHEQDDQRHSREQYVPEDEGRKAVRTRELRRLDEELRASEERYRDVFEQLPVSIWVEDWSRTKELVDDLKARGITDLRTHLEVHPDKLITLMEAAEVVDLSAGTLGIFKADSKQSVLESMTGKNATEWEKEYFLRELVAFSNGATSFHNEGKVEAFDGSDVLVASTAIISPSRQSDWSRVLTLVTDVSAQRRAETELRESERRAREVIDRAVDAFISVDEDETIIDWNPAAERTFGWTRAEVLGRNAIDVLVPVRYRKRHRAGLARYLATGESALLGRWAQLSALRAEGTEFPLEVTVSTQTIQGRRVFNAFVRDITDRKHIETELRNAKNAAEAANKAKSLFLANMSHELRTPLNAILGFAEIMADQMMGLEDPRYASYAASIRESGEHLLAVINDVLDVARVEAGKVELQEDYLDIHKVAQSCLKLLAERASTSGITLRNEVRRDGPALWADAQRLRQILLNLIGNAIKFSPPGTEVRVEVSSTATGLALSVVDEGIGMDPAQIAAALEPFTQIHGGLARTHDGAGLGLSLVRRFARLHGGDITLDSAPGKGTTATVTFPGKRVFADW